MELPRPHRPGRPVAVLALSTALLGGCVVAPYGPYHRPSIEHPAARYKGAWCQGVAGPRSVLELPLAPGVQMTARAERRRAELPLRIELTLPAYQPARFVSASLRVLETGSGRPLGGPPAVTVSRYATLPADAWVDPVRLRPAGAAGAAIKAEAPYGQATLRFSFEPGFVPDQLIFDGLALARDDDVLSMPPVRMRRPASKSSARDYRSVELQAAREQEAAECRRATPERACGNIVEFSPVSFSLVQPAGRWSGRWFVLGDGDRATVEGEVNFTPAAAARWRLATPTVSVRDAAGATRSAAVDRIRVAFVDRVPLDAALFPGGVDSSGDATLWIDVPLPATAGDFELHLPELLLGAQRVSVPVVRFEKRTFDGGIEPFNC